LRSAEHFLPGNRPSCCKELQKSHQRLMSDFANAADALFRFGYRECVLQFWGSRGCED
jgi:hypothetical protein